MESHPEQLIVHTCCPNKRNIYPPMFVVKDTILNGKLIEWECTGNCGTRIMTGGKSGLEGSPHDYRKE